MRRSSARRGYGWTWVALLALPTATEAETFRADYSVPAQCADTTGVRLLTVDGTISLPPELEFLSGPNTITMEPSAVKIGVDWFGKGSGPALRKVGLGFDVSAATTDSGVAQRIVLDRKLFCSGALLLTMSYDVRDRGHHLLHNLEVPILAGQRASYRLETGSVVNLLAMLDRRYDKQLDFFLSDRLPWAIAPSPLSADDREKFARFLASADDKFLVRSGRYLSNWPDNVSYVGNSLRLYFGGSEKFLSFDRDAADKLRLTLIHSPSIR